MGGGKKHSKKKVLRSSLIKKVTQNKIQTSKKMKWKSWGKKLRRETIQIFLSFLYMSWNVPI